MFIFLRYFTILLIVLVDVFVGNNAISAGVDRVLRIYEPPKTDSNGISDMIMFNNRGFFLWHDYDSNSSELWTSDGTENSTKIIKKFTTDYTSIITRSHRFASWRFNGESIPIVLNGNFFLIVRDGDVGPVPEFSLWKSNGTAAGTVRIKNINWRGDGFAVLNNIIYVLDVSGILWRTDGTSAGTWQIALFPPHLGEELIVFRDKLYFAGRDPAHDNLNVYDSELWVSDGTTEGTKLFVDIMPFDKTVCCGLYCSDTCTDSSSDPRDFIVNNNTLYFIADDGVHGRELWKSDGTRAGTVLVKDIWPGSEGSEIVEGFASTDNYLLFWADDGVHGSELWRTNGTRKGTTLLKDFVPGAEGLGEREHYIIGKMNDEIYFTALDAGWNLWKTDGTSKGTKIVKHEVIGFWGVVFEGKLYFRGGTPSDPNNLELWVTDGTSTGTRQLKDILPGVDQYGYSLSSNPRNYVKVNDFILFNASYEAFLTVEGYERKRDGLFKLDKGKAIIAPISHLLLPDLREIE